MGQGLSEKEARLVTTKEYYLRVKAYIKGVNEKWEQTRYLAFTITRMAGRTCTHAPKRPEDLFKLPSDKRNREVIEITENEIEALKNIGLLK